MMAVPEGLQQIWYAITSGSLPELGVWSYVLLTALVFVEGPAITLVAAALAATGVLRADWVFLCSVLGNFLADTFWYLLGYFGGDHRLLLRLGWVRRRWRLIQNLQRELSGHAARMYLLTKLSFGLLTIPVLIAAGLVRAPWYRLALVSLLVEPIWNGFLVLAGYRLGDRVTHMERGLQYLAIAGAVVVLLVFIGLYRRLFRSILRASGAESDPS